jgi:hypothetical protein
MQVIIFETLILRNRTLPDFCTFKVAIFVKSLVIIK